MQLHIYHDTEKLCDALVVFIEEKVKEVLLSSDKFTFALSGGSTPKMLYKKLALSKNIDWSKIHFFWGDERTVPFRDERNNAGMAYEELLDKIPVNKEHIHVMRTDITISESVSAYDSILHQYFNNDTTTFDFVLLGMGDDGHTLSLFPDGDLLNDNISWVRGGVKSGEEIHRITLMPAVVNKSKYIAFLVAGKEKAPMIKNVLELDPYYPANLIDPASKELHWFLDQAAATLLNK